MMQPLCTVVTVKVATRSRVLYHYHLDDLDVRDVHILYRLVSPDQSEHPSFFFFFLNPIKVHGGYLPHVALYISCFYSM